MNGDPKEKDLFEVNDADLVIEKVEKEKAIETTEKENEEVTEKEECDNSKSADEQKSNDDQHYSEIKELIDKHFSSIAGLLRYSKTKDANVLALSKQLQDYRDGFTKSLYKRIALELISFREDCRKSQNSLQAESVSSETAIKYSSFLCDDFYDLMQNIGISQEGDEFFYNGKPLNVEKSSASNDMPQEEPVSDVIIPAIEDLHDLAGYLQSVENAIVSVLQNNAILDSVVSNLIKMSTAYETGLYQVVLYPTIRRMIELYKSSTKKDENDKEVINDENASALYKENLDSFIESIADILFLLDVTIKVDLQDTYDARFNRIIKYVETENEELNGKIAHTYTDCYVMDEKVIYPAKVDVYKTK